MGHDSSYFGLNCSDIRSYLLRIIFGKEISIIEIISIEIGGKYCISRRSWPNKKRLRQLFFYQGSFTNISFPSFMDASRRLRPIRGSIQNIWLSWWNQLLPMFLVNASFSFRSCWFFNPFFEQVLGCRVFKYLPFMYEVDSFKSHSQDEGYIRTFRFYFAPDVCDEKPEHCRNHVFLPRDPHWIPLDMTPKRCEVFRCQGYTGISGIWVVVATLEKSPWSSVAEVWIETGSHLDSQTCDMERFGATKQVVLGEEKTI